MFSDSKFVCCRNSSFTHLLPFIAISDKLLTLPPSFPRKDLREKELNFVFYPTPSSSFSSSTFSLCLSSLPSLASSPSSSFSSSSSSSSLPPSLLWFYFPLPKSQFLILILCFQYLEKIRYCSYWKQTCIITKDNRYNLHTIY